MCYRANTANTMRNRQWMKLGFELKCIVMRMSVHGLQRKWFLGAVHKLYMDYVLQFLWMIPPRDLRPTSNISSWKCNEKLQQICKMCAFLLCHIIREEYCCIYIYIYIVLHLPDLSVMYYCVMNEWTINYCNSA